MAQMYSSLTQQVPRFPVGDLVERERDGVDEGVVDEERERAHVAGLVLVHPGVLGARADLVLHGPRRAERLLAAVPEVVDQGLVVFILRRRRRVVLRAAELERED